MPKNVVVGAGGQLARDLISRLGSQVAGLSRSECDLTRPDETRAKLTALRPDMVFNCSAYNFVDRAESEPEAAFAVNGWGVRHLAMICRDLDCILVHYSTNYVFGLDVQRSTPYFETDIPGPINAYGVGKLAGEYFVRAICPKHFVIRTAALFGLGAIGGKGNFVELMLRLAREGQSIRVVNDQVCTPTSTADLAVATIALLKTGRYGLYQITNSGSSSWHEYAQTIFDLTGVRANLKGVTSEEFGAPAKRPHYSVMASTAYEALGFKPLRPWREALAEYLAERKDRDRALASSKN
jgi:dTDP-4-dehydrorhamnose reductase